MFKINYLYDFLFGFFFITFVEKPKLCKIKTSNRLSTIT